MKVFDVEERRVVWQEQANAIEGKLLSKVSTIKDGHRVKDINPDGQKLEVPLSSAKKARMMRELRFLWRHIYGESKYSMFDPSVAISPDHIRPSVRSLRTPPSL